MISSIVFQGLDLLKRTSSLREDAQKLETEGLRKIDAAVAGLEVEGLYRLLRGAISQSSISYIPPPPKRPCHTPSATISKPPSQEPEEAVPKSSTPVAEVMEQALEVTTPAVSPALEVAIPTQMRPLHLLLGVSRGCISVGLRVAQRGCQPLMLQSVDTYAESTWGEAGISLL